MSIVLSVNEPWHYRNWEPVLRHLPSEEVSIHVTPWRWHLPRDPAVRREHVEETVNWLRARGVESTAGPLQIEPNVLGTLGIEPRMVGREYTRQVRMLYAVISKQYTYSRKNEPYDEVLVASRYGQERMEAHGILSRVVGYPKLDDWFTGKLDRAMARRRLGLADDAVVVLYAPTLGELCTVERYAEALVSLHSECELLVQLHPVSYLKERARFSALDERARFVPPADAGLETLAAADVVVTDYSGVIFEACALDCPVVLLDEPGLPMTDCVERVHRDAGIRVESPSEVATAVRESLSHPGRYAERRGHYRETFFEHHGEAGAMAAEALLENVERSRKARQRDVDLIYSRLRRFEVGVGR